MARKGNKKSEIIEAAIRVFAEKGFFNAKVADVAREAGVADGTIYLYFKNKDDLLISLFETKMEVILSRFQLALQKTVNACDQLRLFVTSYFQMIYDDQQLAEVFQVELRQSGKFLKDYHNQKFFDFLNLIGNIIHTGQKQGEFSPAFKINTIKLAIFGSLDELARQWILSDEPKYEILKISDEVTDLFLKGLKP